MNIAGMAERTAEATPHLNATIFNLLLPERLDNTHRGHKVALWLLSLIVLMRVVMSLNSILNGRHVASSADGIPLETYMPAAAQTAVSLFALLGFSNLMICLVCVLVLARYRSAVPLMFTLLLLQYLGGRLLLHYLPIVRTGTPPGLYVNLSLLVLMIVGFVLSLRSQDNLRRLD